MARRKFKATFRAQLGAFGGAVTRALRRAERRARCQARLRRRAARAPHLFDDLETRRAVTRAAMLGWAGGAWA